jgi:TPP-dependent pyruvate/acetoin dehydrogenase alpha subunit
MPYTKDFLLSLYQMMIRIRFCEESFVPPILDGTIKCPVHLYSGQEAIAVGVSANLTHSDKVFGNHRSHGHFLAKGGPVSQLVAEVFCKESGCSRGRGGSMHLVDPSIGFLGAAPIVAGTVSLALGAALGNKIKGNDSIAVTYFGDGATGEGVLYEAMNFASIYKLPLLFVCENNYYATHMPLREIRSRESIYEVALPFDIKAERGDGNDILEVYEMAKKAVFHCRGGKGPFFLEFETYRLRGHVGPDDNVQGHHTDIRPLGEVEAWRKKDPISRFRQYLLETKKVSRVALDRVDKEIEAEIAEAHELAINSQNPDVKELGKYVFQNAVA